MSPIYATGPAKPRPQRPPVKEITPAPDHEASKAPAHTKPLSAEEAPVATAVIPPPLEKAQPESAEPKKPATAEAKQEAAPEPHKTLKYHKRTARHYAASRLSVPYPARWYFSTAGANRGWGGGQFGPSPYSSNGQ